MTTCGARPENNRDREKYITVSMILLDYLRYRRWREAAAAAAVVATLALGAILGKKWGQLTSTTFCVFAGQRLSD
jgi:hypothetical protein